MSIGLSGFAAFACIGQDCKISRLGHHVCDTSSGYLYCHVCNYMWGGMGDNPTWVCEGQKAWDYRNPIPTRLLPPYSLSDLVG